MYAELFPSAQRFISAVDANVNVELRTISGVTGPLLPLRASPRCIAVVASPHFRPFSLFAIPHLTKSCHSEPGRVFCERRRGTCFSPRSLDRRILFLRELYGLSRSYS